MLCDVGTEGPNVILEYMIVMLNLQIQRYVGTLPTTRITSSVPKQLMCHPWRQNGFDIRNKLKINASRA